MIRTLLISFLVFQFWPTGDVRAYELANLKQLIDPTSLNMHNSSGTQIDFTSTLIESQEYTQIHNSDHISLFPFPSDQNMIGDIQIFFTRNIFNPLQWDQIDAQLIYDSSGVNIWVEARLVGSILSSQELNKIAHDIPIGLHNKTPQNSVDSTSGVIEIMHELFGLPPIINEDESLHILMLDIKDDFESTGNFIAGYFDPNDLTESETSNRRTMLYIDVNPSLMATGSLRPSLALHTIAHEYQHLIHVNYEQNEREFIFINEGCSELAEILCGYPPRSPEMYYANPELPLFTWNRAYPLVDYSRASLWSHYFFEQVGFEHISELVQDPNTGPGQFDTLSWKYLGLSLANVVHNWNIANLVNNIQINDAYGYRHPERSTAKQPPKITEHILPVIGSQTLGQFASTSVMLPHVFRTTIHCDTPNIQFSRIRFPIGEGLPTIEGGEDEVYLNPQGGSNDLFVFTDYSLVQTAPDAIQTTANYIISGRKSGVINEISYDDGVADIFSHQASYLLLEIGDSVAVRYERFDDFGLESISLNSLFLSELSNSVLPIDADRDVLISIATDAGGDVGKYLIKDHLHVFERRYGTIVHEKVELTEYYGILRRISGPFYVIITNDPDDENLIAIGLDDSVGVSYTSIFSPGYSNGGASWIPFNELNYGASNLGTFNAMCRANILEQVNYIVEDPSNVNLYISNSSVEMNVSIPFTADAALSRVIVGMPSGELLFPQLEIEPKKVALHFPLQIHQDYKIYVHLAGLNSIGGYATEFSWQAPMLDGHYVLQNFPNPFNSVTGVPVLVRDAGFIRLSVYNILGKEVAHIDRKHQEPGTEIFELDLSNVASGIYFTNIYYRRDESSSEISKTIKMTLIK